VGPSVIDHYVRGIIELLCCLWICAYVLNCSLQCLLKSILGSIIIVRGLSVGWIPSLCKQISQNTALYTISTISRFGNILKSSVLTIALVLTFTVLMNLSVSGICSSLPVMFTFMLCSSIIFLMHSNRLLLSMCFTQ